MTDEEKVEAMAVKLARIGFTPGGLTVPTSNWHQISEFTRLTWIRAARHVLALVAAEREACAVAAADWDWKPGYNMTNDQITGASLATSQVAATIRARGD